MRPPILLASLEPSPFRLAPADRALLQGILDGSGVDRSIPAPSWAAYARDLIEASLGQLARGLSPLRSWLGGTLDDVEVPALVLLIAILVTLAYLAIRTILGHAYRRWPRTAAPAAVVSPGPAPRTEPADAWRRELEARLAQGDVAGALDALWWWLARSLLGPRVEPAWTTRELIASAERKDLSPLVSTLDRLIYGTTTPTAEEVRRLLTRLEEAVA